MDRQKAAKVPDKECEKYGCLVGCPGRDSDRINDTEFMVCAGAQSGGRNCDFIYALLSFGGTHGHCLYGRQFGKGFPESPAAFSGDGSGDGGDFRNIWFRCLADRTCDARCGPLVELSDGNSDDPDGSADVGCDPDLSRRTQS